MQTEEKRGVDAGIARFWHRLTDIGDPDPLPAHDLADTGVADALAVIDVGHRTPSAGAIHPHECYVVSRAGDGLALFQVDARARICRRLRAARSPELALTAANLPVPRPGEAHILVVTRPWLSMRKYGHRGFLYTQIDAAHLATSLLGVARDRDPRAVLRLRVDHRALSELLGLGLGLREVHSVVSFGSSGQPVDTDGWTGLDARDADPLAEFQNPLELACRTVIDPQLSLSDEPPSLTPRPISLATAAASAEPPSGTWTELTRLRKSSKQFRPGVAIPESRLTQAVAAASWRLPIDLPADGIELTVVPQGDRRATMRACMLQRHLGDAGAYVLLHTAHDELLDHRHTLHEMIFRAGAVGHLVYLGATAAGLGVTGVGGFDGPRWLRIAGLPADHKVLYVLALGQDDHTGTKLDRLQPAYAQAER
ncbi:nitroreductase family protein [Kutzneria sp. CA-103260]|uniref:nitroreductase family protein n=1 Tax=Kutzneria sp. CA-103260 TaxID=2802641 RepID=UPI001BA5A3F7|nr:nitroreductase family protein [Kutzneria sp. CA-103260]QUQ63949.1 Nitroreductase family protein [Kutzneria sp. CA-103260]